MEATTEPMQRKTWGLGHGHRAVQRCEGLAVRSEIPYQSTLRLWRSVKGKRELVESPRVLEVSTKTHGVGPVGEDAVVLKESMHVDERDHHIPHTLRDALTRMSNDSCKQKGAVVLAKAFTLRAAARMRHAGVLSLEGHKTGAVGARSPTASSPLMQKAQRKGRAEISATSGKDQREEKRKKQNTKRGRNAEGNRLKGPGCAQT